MKQLLTKLKYFKHYFFRKVPNDLILYGDDVPPKICVSGLMKILASGNRFTDLSDLSLEKCKENDFNVQSAIGFRVSLPLHLAIIDKPTFFNYCGFREGHLFSVLLKGQFADGNRLVRSDLGEIIFKDNVTVIDLLVFVRDLSPGDLSEGLIDSAIRYGYASLNQFIMAYMAAANDHRAEFAVSERGARCNFVTIFENDLKTVSFIHTIINKPPDSHVVPINKESLPEIAKIAANLRPEESAISSVFYKLLAQKHQEEGRYREAVMEIQIYVESLVTKLVYWTDKNNDLTLEKLTGENFGSILNNRVTSKLGMPPFSKSAKETQSNKIIYQYYHYCYTLRNKTVHSNWFPHKLECDIAIDVALNLTGYLAHEFEKKYPGKIPFELQKSLILKDVDEAIESLSLLFPDLYQKT